VTRLCRGGFTRPACASANKTKGRGLRLRKLRPLLSVGDTGIEPVTSSVSRKRAPAAPIARMKCEVETGFEPVYTALQAVASPLGHSTELTSKRSLRADDGIRTRDPHLGKVMRYQLRYVRLSPQVSLATTELYLVPRPHAKPGSPACRGTMGDVDIQRARPGCQPAIGRPADVKARPSSVTAADS
jgi:hypothetical protein